MMQEIEDTEIRIIGGKPTPAPRRKWPWLVAVLLLLSAGLVVALIKNHNRVVDEKQPEVVEQPQQTHPQQSHPLRSWVHSLDSITTVGAALYDTIVDEVPIRIYVPLNCRPRLEVGYQCIEDCDNNILLFQAADVRADNKKIVGAFVLRGQPLSWGLSKRGYCGIIDGEITVGVADNSPLFEQATESAGYFFRQYPLVDNGQWVENELPTSSLRRGLCQLEGRMVVVETQQPATLNEFAQLLAHIGADNAIYLVGSTSIGWYRDLDGNGVKRGLWDNRIYKNVNFIIWGR